MKRLAPLAILLFLAYDIFIRFYANTDVVIFGRTEDGYNYGHLYSMVIALLIPLVMAKGNERPIVWGTLGAMVLNYFDVCYFNPIAFEANDLLLLPCIALWLYGILQQRVGVNKYNLALVLILPMYLTTRNAAFYTNSYGIKYVMAAGDAAIFFLVSVYAGFKLIGTQQALVFLFFMLCINNLLDNTIYDPYSFGHNEMLFAIIISIDALLLGIRRCYAKTIEKKLLHRHIFIAVNVLMIAALILFPWL